MADIPVQVKITADTDQAVSGIKKVDAAVDGLAASSKSAKASSAGLTTAFSKTGVSAALASNKSRMLTQQLSQVAQQTTATGNVVQALAVQAADIGLAFGVVGTVVGAVAGIALPTLIAAFSNGSTSADAFEEALEGISESGGKAEEVLDRLRLSIDDLVVQYGVAAQRVREFSLAQAELLAAQTERRLRDQIGLVRDLSNEYTKATRGNIGNIAALRRDFSVTTDQARELFGAFRQLENQDTFEGQQQQLQNILGLLRDMNVDLSEIPTELNLALQEMLSLGVETARVTELMAQLGAEARNVTVGVPLFEQGFSGQGLLPPASTGSGGGGGGGGRRGGGGRSRSRVTSLLESLQTERETLEAWRTESMDLLMQANEQELEILGGHNEAKLRLQEEYRSRLQSLQQQEQSQTLGSYSTLFGNLATAFQSGSGKLLKIGKAFSVAQGLINSYRAYTEVLADPSLIGRPFLRTALAASTLASGLAQVANIKSVSESGGGAGAGGAAGGAGAASTPAQPSQNIVIDLVGETFGRNSVEALFDQINEGLRNGNRIEGVLVR